ncbi:MAG TPA: DUF5060 domain-containing protein [Acidiferrobacteraceae bacterium]|nr:DUF5060 domain-containing protein [Acidiferrobacteraceae bacterium]
MLSGGIRSTKSIMTWLDQHKQRLSAATGCVLALLLLMYSAATPAVRVIPVFQGEVWDRDFDYTLPLANPFDTAELALRVTFISPSKTEKVITGFHVGDGVGGQSGIVWRTRFVPEEAGLWTYTYKWVDATILESDDTNDETVDGEGALFVVLGYEAQLEKLQAGESGSTTTGLADPLIHVPFYVALEDYLKVDDPRMGVLLDYVKDRLGANGVAIILKNRVWNACQGTNFCSPGFDFLDVANWDRLDLFMKMLEERDLAVNIMFYGNGDEAPGFEGESATETILLQYAVSRLSPYKRVSFDSGINILEYRDSEWSKFFADRISDLDPNDRPLSSRQSAGFTPFACTSCTYDSLGDKNPDFDTILTAISGSSNPIFYTDRWRVGFTDGLFDVGGIRQSMWYTYVAGGAGFILGGRNGALRLDDFENDLKSTEQYKVFSDFWGDEDRDASTYTTCNDKVDVGRCFGENDREYVIYLEQEGALAAVRGDEIRVDLSDWTLTADVSWIDPKTGDVSNESMITVGDVVTLTVPGNEDWVLVINIPQLPELKTAISRVVGVLNYNFSAPGSSPIIPRVIGVIDYSNISTPEVSADSTEVASDQ